MNNKHRAYKPAIIYIISLLIIITIFCNILSFIIVCNNIVLLKIIMAILNTFIIITLLIKYIMFIDSMHSHTTYCVTKSIYRKVNIKVIKKMHCRMTNGYVTKNDLLTYYKEHYHNIINDYVWREAALIYYWISEFDGNELASDSLLYKQALRDTYLHQNDYIVYITEIIYITLVEKEGTSWIK